MMKKSNESQIIRDWTNETIVIDMENAIGEKYHFEIPPGADPKSVPLRASDSPTLGTRKTRNTESTLVWLLYPIAKQLDMFEERE